MFKKDFKIKIVNNWKYITGGLILFLICVISITAFFVYKNQVSQSAKKIVEEKSKEIEKTIEKVLANQKNNLVTINKDEKTEKNQLNIDFVEDTKKIKLVPNPLKNLTSEIDLVNLSNWIFLDKNQLKISKKVVNNFLYQVMNLLNSYHGKLEYFYEQKDQKIDVYLKWTSDPDNLEIENFSGKFSLFLTKND